MTLTKKNNVHAFFELSVAEEFFIELEKKVEELLDKAQKRARANNRRTVFARDL